jgi:aspartyl-tRNA(Asn)/glutamyl-tRNA(Gln) amidotransferase subunit A
MTLTNLSLAEAARLVASREVSPVELTRACLDRIERLDRQINAFITRTADQALHEASEAEAAIARGDRIGPLHGIPLALKDLYDTRGVRTTAGSSFFAAHVPDRDAAVVERLRRAGAVILGKLNLHEIALGVTNDNPHFGPCRNPWDTARVTGGSSGGSAAALAAEMCFGALGSDTGGSIRIPASLCGIVGLKPTYGRVSLRGAVPLSWNLDHAGPMTRRVMDAATMLDVIAGFDPEDPGSANVPNGNWTAGVAGGVARWHVGVASGEALANVDADVAAAFQAAVSVFASLGAVVQEVELPELSEAARLNGMMTTSDAATFHHERLAKSPDGFGADVLARLRRGESTSRQDYAQARRTQQILRRRFESWFHDGGGSLDVLLTPATPIPAPIRDGMDAVALAPVLTRFTAPFNFTGMPALSLPCGFTRGGLPIGLQIVAAPWREVDVLRAGHAFEQATEWHKNVVPIAGG